MSGSVLGTGQTVTNKSRCRRRNVASSGGRLTLVTKVQGLVFTGDWIFWSFCNWLTDVLLPWYWQSSLQGIWIILVCVKLIRFSVVSSLRVFSCNMEFPDKANDNHSLPDGFNHPIICGFSDFSMYSSSLTMIPAFYQASHVKLSSIRCSVQFSRSVMSDSLRPYELQHARPPCPSLTPGVHSDSRPSSEWCHPTISSWVIPFSSCPHLSQHQSLFQWVNPSHEVAKVLEFQL